MGDTVIVAAEGDTDSDTGLAFAAGMAAAEAETASEDAAEASAAAEIATETATAALEVAAEALAEAGTDEHSHGEYVTRDELREMADAYVLELVAINTAEPALEGGDGGEDEPEEDVPPPSIESTQERKKPWGARYDNA